MLRAVFVVVVALHGAVHLLGFAKAFNLAQLPQLTQPISRTMGVLWLVAAMMTLTTAGLLVLAPGWAWPVGALALVASQAVIITSWRDAKFGTLANVVVLLLVGWAFAAHGPLGLRAAFARDVATATHTGKTSERPLLREADLATLPEPVQRSVRAAGVVDKPRPRNLRATWVGRMRSAPDAAWMEFTAEQVNTFDPPRRFFFMDAVMKGLPVDVLHAFDEGGATMKVRLLSLISMVNAGGEGLTRAETVTLFNDLCVLAPGELVRPSIAWEAVDAHSARARYTQGVNTITATLFFDDAGTLVDFRSDDRGTSPTDAEATRQPWTTPLRDFGVVGPARVARQAEVRWHPPTGAWTYGEFELRSLAYDVGD
jgi:hypothetical protein